jgi:hypothetical protein
MVSRPSLSRLILHHELLGCLRCRGRSLLIFAAKVRKATLRSLLVKVGPGIRWNEHIEGDGETIFRACH